MWITLNETDYNKEKIVKLFSLFDDNYNLNMFNQFDNLKEEEMEAFVDKNKKYELIDIIKCYGNNFQINFYRYKKSKSLFGGYFLENDEMRTIHFKYIKDKDLYLKIFTIIYDNLMRIYDEESLKEYIKYKNNF